jgi:hypothetical protein
MIKVHLTQAQRDLCNEFLDSHSERPTFTQYTEFQIRMKGIDRNSLGEKPKQKTIPNSIRGFTRGDVKLLDGFNARNDLPAGWAVYSHYDSGGNHGLISAGQITLTMLWNNWGAVHSDTRLLVRNGNDLQTTETSE